MPWEVSVKEEIAHERLDVRGLRFCTEEQGDLSSQPSANTVAMEAQQQFSKRRDGTAQKTLSNIWRHARYQALEQRVEAQNTAKQLLHSTEGSSHSKLSKPQCQQFWHLTSLTSSICYDSLMEQL